MPKVGEDLLSTGGTKGSSNTKANSDAATSEGSGGKEIPTVGAASFPKDNDLLSKANGTGNTGTTEDTRSTAGSKDEPTTAKTTDRSVDSLMDEVKKAREEAKKYRLEKNDAIERLRTEYEKKIEEVKDSVKPLSQKADELEKLKAKEEDRKRSLEEKLAHREAILAEKEQQILAQKEHSEREAMSLKAELEKYRADINIQNQFYEEKLNEELLTIPEKFKGIADLMVKGAGDRRSALDVIRDAKLQGVFKDKTTVVSHQIPGVEEGARLSSETVKGQEKDKKDKLSSQDKIGLALKTLKSNNMFRDR